MNIILNNLTDNTTKTINITEKLEVPYFIKNIYSELEPLEPMRYYRIVFKHPTDYGKLFKAKLGYIFNDFSNEKRIILTCNPNYVQFMIDKYSLTELEIECTRYIGFPQKISAQIEREQLSMGDSGPYLSQEIFSTDIMLSKLISNLPYQELYNFIDISYKNVLEKEESLRIVDEKKLVINDMPLSEFIFMHKVDPLTELKLKLKKYDLDKYDWN